MVQCVTPAYTKYATYAPVMLTPEGVYPAGA